MMKPIRIENLSDVAGCVQDAAEPVVLVIEPGDVSFCGQVIDGLYGFRMGDRTPNLETIVRDFRNYEAPQGRTPMVFALKGALIPTTDQDAGNSSAEWVVHSTDGDAGESILCSGRLLSHKRLREEGISFRAFGRGVLGEPPDYFNLIQFANAEEYGAEIVVASKEHGRFCSDADEYNPGVRFYFRVESLKEQPGYTAFMGGHAMRDGLSLDQIDYVNIRVEDLPEKPPWTPRKFTDAANRRFEEIISKRREVRS